MECEPHQEPNPWRFQTRDHRLYSLPGMWKTWMFFFNLFEIKDCIYYLIRHLCSFSWPCIFSHGPHEWPRCLWWQDDSLHRDKELESHLCSPWRQRTFFVEQWSIIILKGQSHVEKRECENFPQIGDPMLEPQSVFWGVLRRICF